MVNAHGLSRSIPQAIKREVRQRSKFGCVMCRCAFYQYEHIDPPFETAREHSPDNICCLCGRCHDSVTRGRISKAAVRVAYNRVQGQSNEDAGPPIGPLDYHDGRAQLAIGGLVYASAVRTMLRYHGEDLITVRPGIDGEQGSISAVFTDDEGDIILRLVENEWVGDLENWDIEVTGARIVVRKKLGEIALAIRLEPPGRVVVERLDMRFWDGHLLASEYTYAAGRHIQADAWVWVWINIAIHHADPGCVAIEYADPQVLQQRATAHRHQGSSMASADGRFLSSGVSGVAFIPAGICVASMCMRGFNVYQMVYGFRSIGELRECVFHRSAELPQFLSSGVLNLGVP